MTKRLRRMASCYRCGYEWRLRQRLPRHCARCKSPRWADPFVRIPNGGTGQGVAEVIDPVRGELVALGRKYHASLSVFGSVARQAATPTSDVDLLVEYRRPTDILTNVRFRRELESLFGRRVDLVTEGALHWFVQPQVLAEAIPIP